MTDEQKFKIEALKYAVYICDTRKSTFKSDIYNVACDEIKLFLEASIERLESGGGLYAYCIADQLKT